MAKIHASYNVLNYILHLYQGVVISRLAEYRKLGQQLAAQLAELDALKNDTGLQAEIEFESKLRGLLAEYGYSLRNVISLLDPAATTRRKSSPLAAPEKGIRKARELNVYKNPYSGEIVETKGGNHKLLKAWKNEHGSDVVESGLSK